MLPEYHEFIDTIGTAPELLEEEPAQRLILIYLASVRIDDADSDVEHDMWYAFSEIRYPGITVSTGSDHAGPGVVIPWALREPGAG